MAESTKKKGAKLSRTETVTVRFDPKLRYLAELAARKQRRTLSSFIEWAVEHWLQREPVSNHCGNDSATFFDVSESLWDISESDRLLILADNYPHLLNHDEQVTLKIIKEMRAYDKVTGIVSFYDAKSGPRHELIRDCWKEIKGLVDGEITENQLRDVMTERYLPF